MFLHNNRSGTARATLFRLLLGFGVLVASSACAELANQTAAPASGSPTRLELEQLLATVPVVPDRPHPGGYDRGCSPGEGCVFGPAWSDDYDGPGGHDGCDTRNNVLSKQLTEVAYRSGTHDCVVTSGVLDDPYTGKRISFSKADARDIQIDHVYALAAAWDLGAASWPLERRVQFANDIDSNLLATDASANQSKGDSTPAEWLPPARAYHCFYASKYLTAARQYELPITAADNAALSGIARGCP